ncbi:MULTISPECIES: hypothetical protein [Paenibacillus]|uniref:Uncharacterized protein n=1 Tax=Paenibacillus azoreducens TaxID=116718 RepID=A0A919Y894_9BACL|nr:MULTISPECIES: hypothetical protein [Paenibacillus]MBE9913923.1 hypothetical protein [Paenibacillus donghaensis]GIO45644.1 hypothetical protein J34TS1_04090 [Paenibacillus azoreducens]
MDLYFRDNFFNAGYTEIINERHEPAGSLDLKSALGSSLDVIGADGTVACSGRFRMMSNKWEVRGPESRLLGVLRHQLSLMSKKFIYETEGRGIYEIFSPAFSKEYSIADESGVAVARFEKINGWFESGAYCLRNGTERLGSYELIAVVMGVHETNKREANVPYANMP